VTAAAFDSARLAAGYEASGDRAQGRLRAEHHLREILGSYAARPGFVVQWGDDPTGRSVVLTVRAENPSFVPATLRRPMGLDHVERTVRVRVEDA
jgi:hypothetical protein